jgi:hypothetical protein
MKIMKISMAELLTVHYLYFTYKKPARGRFLLLPIRLLQQKYPLPAGTASQFGQQRQTVDTNIFIFSVHHHVLEELIHRLAQGGQLNQRFLVTAFGETAAACRAAPPDCPPA